MVSRLAGLALVAVLASGCFSSADKDSRAEAKSANESQITAKPAEEKPGGPEAAPAVASAPVMPASRLAGETLEPPRYPTDPSRYPAEPARYPSEEPQAKPPVLVPEASPVSPSPGASDPPPGPFPVAPSRQEPLKPTTPNAPGTPDTRPNPLRDPTAASGARVPSEAAGPTGPGQDLAPAPRTDAQVRPEEVAVPRGADGQGLDIRVSPAIGTEVKPADVAEPKATTKQSDARVGPASGSNSRPEEVAEPKAHRDQLPFGKHKEKFDPIKVNGPIFEGWPKPKLAVVMTGRQDGYLEPCGCAGLDRMKGGMARRHTLLKTLRANGWPIVVLDVGGIANKRFSHQAVLKFQTSLEAMWKMGYDVIMLGPNDLKLPSGEVLAATLGVGDRPSLFVSANVNLADTTPTTRIVEVGGKRLAITGVLGKKYQKEINNTDLVMTDPIAALAKLVPELKKKADGLVLLAHADMQETLEIAGKFPQFDLVVTAGGAPEAPTRLDNLRPIPGSKAKLIEVGEKGMDVIVLGLFDDPQQPVRYQRVPLDSRFASSTDMKARMGAYQGQLKSLGLERLGVKPQPHPLSNLLGGYVGSEKCESCHAESYKIWKRTPHATALQSLVKADPARNFDPECIACHVVGWNSREYHPYQSGYLSQEKTPKLNNVGCEDCHGPGENHVKAENTNNKQWQQQLQQAIRITKEEAANPASPKQNCFSCHDGDNSPDFDFKTYWPHVEHYEKE